MSQTQTMHLIFQAAHELELGQIEVMSSTDKPGFYEVTKTEPIAMIPMGADFKGIISALRGEVSKDQASEV